jgi:tetratricopeptide (TPR) repeat protein
MDTNLKSKLKKVLVVLGIAAGVFAVLAGIYFYGSLHYPQSLLSAYQEKDCETALSSHGMITRFYPYRSLQENTTGPALECALYTNAEKLQEDGKWQDAYQAFKTCAETYPEGVLAPDAHEQAALSLLSQAAEQQEQKAYAESVETLERVMAEYPSQPEAAERYVDVHLAWGGEHQSRGEFQPAEEVLLSLGDWSQAGEYETHLADCQSALSGLYLAWGESHQSAGELVPAMAKYRQSVEAAPDSEFASLAAEKQVEILLAQGDTYMDAGDYQSAIDAYQRGVSDVNDAGKDRLNTATAQAYLAWAKHNIEREDYYQALGKVEIASGLPLSETAKGDVESYKQEIYTAFANSSGSQATRLIQDAARALCKNEKKTFPPVLGIDPDASGLILYGIDKSLPDEWVAKTPAQFKYVVCAELATEVVQEIKSRVVWYGRPETAYTHTFTRTQYMWKIKVVDIVSRDVQAVTVIKGSAPPPLDEQQIKSRTIVGSLVIGWPGRPVQPLPPSTEGGQPDFKDLIRWLEETVMK